MKLSDFDYKLPLDLIAQTPIEPRDHCRLLVLDRQTGKTDHRHFYNLLEYLRPGDLLVVNNSKVFPARLIGCKETGGAAEIFLNHEIEPGVWETLGKNVKIGQTVTFSGSKLRAEVIEKREDVYFVKFNLIGPEFFSEVEKIGRTPLPPYIKRESEKSSDRTQYQTIYANPIGSAAAPTAGLHFTPELMAKIREKGVEILEITLHVGLGTFAPVKIDDIEKHEMHSEYYTVDGPVIDQIISTKAEGNRVIAVGTTSTRVLEHIFLDWDTGKQTWQKKPQLTDWTKIFIYPGFQFKCVDGMVTNFHLPKSTLLMLISAFAGKEKIFQAYDEAVQKKYRFFSYGDAMLIL